MNLRKKIFVSFLISACIIAAVIAFQHYGLIEMEREIRYLEITDTIRSKSLQLRRHEKNFFLYGLTKANEEADAVGRYLDELDTVAADAALARDGGGNGNVLAMKTLVTDYRARFASIRSLLQSNLAGFESIRAEDSGIVNVSPLVAATFFDRPADSAVFLRKKLGLDSGHPLITGLEKLAAEIAMLRENGESILAAAKEMDRMAREKVEGGIRASRLATAVFFPVFLAVGAATIYVITGNVSKRLALLTEVAESTGKGSFRRMSVTPRQRGNDEVGLLIEKFDAMEAQLIARDEEIARKNSELLKNKKLATIGTLASGIAHELNNPLNNISISTQMLMREAGDDCPPMVKEIVNDIHGQTVRVKRIVGDLLEFARGREPQPASVPVGGVIGKAWELVSRAANVEDVRFSLESPDGLMIEGDPEQLERVFINLFTNAVDAMRGAGGLAVNVAESAGMITITVSDTGAGISREDIEKIFDPFYTTKEKGTGLGLAIVSNIVRKHGGDMTVESETGSGATFTIALPSDRGNHAV
ncbi:MAG: GHKL domain-containing protein [Nitrospirae bacterium]|nr:GHKL domain-containing protein [Nitrospirota bacterium]